MEIKNFLNQINKNPINNSCKYINKFFKNPIAFRGTTQTRDTVELNASSKNNPDYQAAITAFDNEIAKLQDQIQNSKREVNRANKENIELNEIASNICISQEDVDVLNKHIFSRKKEDTSIVQSIINNLLDNAFYDASKNKEYSRLAKKALETILSSQYFKNNPFDIETINEKLKEKIRKHATDKITSPDYHKNLNAIESCELEIKKAERRKAFIDKNPQLAFLFNPNYSDEEKAEIAKKSNVTITLEDKQEFSGISAKAKNKIKRSMKHPTLPVACIMNSSENQERLKTLENKTVVTIEELPNYLDEGLYEKTIFNGVYIINETGNEVIKDYEAKKIISPNALARKFNVGKGKISSIPFILKSYKTEDGRNITTSLIDLTNESNLNALKRFHFIIPKNSPYFNEEGLGEENKKLIKIPTNYLARLGFGEEEKLNELIDSGELNGGFVEKDGKTIHYITIDCRQTLDENKELQTLEQLRNDNPNIKTFKALKKELGVSEETLNQALFDGELNVISHCLNPYDKEARYIDVSDPKNQDFYQRLRTEKEIRDTLLQEERRIKKEEKIKHLEYSKRLNSLRMSLAWDYMPNTRKIASQMAKQDGYLCSLFAKMDDETQELTRREKIKVRTFYKEMWLTTGTQELQEAHKKASEAIRLYEKLGIEALDDNAKNKFKEYGFV